MNKIVIIGLGNDILGDDAIGLIAARELKNQFGNKIDVFESPNAGLELLDYLQGYEKALILDSLYTGQYPAGTIVTYSASDFESSSSATPHYIGLPEVIKLAEKLEIPIPIKIDILLMEVENPYEVTTEMSRKVRGRIEEFVTKSKDIITGFWEES